MTQPSAQSVEHLLREITPQVLGALDAAAPRFRRCGGRGPGSVAGRVDAVAARRRAREPREAGCIELRSGGSAITCAVTPRAAAAKSSSRTSLRTRMRCRCRRVDEEFEPEQDDTLVLLFMCSHPSLTAPSAIALTLRAVGGLTTREIGAAFLVPEATMAQRISRAKQTIKESNVPFSMPSAQERAERLDAVMHVLYLIFNEGYASFLSSEALQRVDLVERSHPARPCAERVSCRTRPEAGSLLALMLLTDARRLARTGSAGEAHPARRAEPCALGRGISSRKAST